MIKNWQRNLLIVVAVIGAFPLTSFLLNPLHNSENNIRRAFIEQTPIGSSKEDVISIIESSLKHELVFSIDGAPVRKPGERFSTIGESHIQVELGSHFTHSVELNILFPTYVYSYWAFDSDNNLIDIIIYKERDAL